MAEVEGVRDRETQPRVDGRTDGRVDGRPGIGTYVGTVALVGLGVALIEEELLAGMLLGVAAMAFPNLVPKLGRAVRPLLKSAVRAGYGLAAKTRETVAEVGEQFEDVIAEVRAEHEHGAASSTTPEHERPLETPSAETGEASTEPGRGRKSPKT
jgi:hypothetical protein